jgi:large subunit ribosomal protein L10
MLREAKAGIVEELAEVFDRCQVGILTDYRGLTTAEITDLRRMLRNSGIQYRVVKNTLARFAADKLGKKELAAFFEGPVAVALGYDDIGAPARVLANYIRSQKTSLSIKGGFFGDEVLTQRDVEKLAALPSREVLLSQVLAGMQSPIAALISCLAGPVRGLVGVLQARVNQLEGG